MRIGRRGMLVGAASATLAACAPDARPHGAATPSPRPAPTRAPATTSRRPERPSPSPSPTPAGAAVPTRADVVAEFGDQAPTQWGLEVDGVVLRSRATSICLTFDACGGRHGSDVDDELLTALVDTATPATLFLNSRWIEANPRSTRDLMANPLFELANHGTAHVPLSVTSRKAYGIPGTASAGEVHDEVVTNQELMASLLGKPPRFFRSGTAHYDDVAARIVHALGLIPVNFDTNADGGATFTRHQVRAATEAATPGSICIAHLNQPGSGTAAGMADAIAAMRQRGVVFARLGDVLDDDA